MKKSLHTKAYEYLDTFTDFNGDKCSIRKVIALVPTAPSINDLVNSWNLNKNHTYKVLNELPVQKAIHMRGLKGSSIANDWQLLDHMPFHSVEVEIIKDPKVLVH